MAPAQEGQTATNPQTGEKLVYQGGAWVSAGSGSGAAPMGIHWQPISGTGGRVPPPQTATQAAIDEARLAGERLHNQQTAAQLAAQTGTIPVLGDPTKTGAEYLATLPPSDAAIVKAMMEGRKGAPTGYAQRSPVAMRLMAEANIADPTLDDASLPGRVATRKAFTSGVQSQQTTSQRTALDHLTVLAQRAEELHNGRFPIWNSIANAFEYQVGDPARTNYENALGPVTSEDVKAFRGSSGNEADIDRAIKALSSSNSPAQIRGGVSTLAGLLAGRIKETTTSYNTGMGTTDQTVPGMTPDTTKILAALQDTDYANHGLGAISTKYGLPSFTGGAGPPAAGGGLPARGTGGGQLPPPPAPPMTPSAGPVGAGPLPPGGGAGIPDTEAPHAVPPEYEQFRADLENGINNGILRDPQAVMDFAKTRNFQLDPAQVQGTFDQIKKGGRAIVATPVTPPNQTLSTGGTAVANAGNSIMFGAMPKGGALLDTLGAKLSGDDRSFGTIYDRNLAANNATLDQGDEQHPIAALGGSVAGFAAGDAALGAAPGVARLIGRAPAALRPAIGDALYGTAYGIGSGEGDFGQRVESALGNGALAVGGGLLGRGLARTGAAVVSPLVAPAARRLSAAGITLTPGQLAGAATGPISGPVGRFVKGMEDKLTSVPGLGDLITSSRRSGVEEFNRAAINDALAPIGKTLPTDIKIGHDAVAHAQQAVSGAYDSALAPLRAPIDAQLTSEISDVGRQVAQMPADHQAAFKDIMENDVQPYWPSRTGVFDGEALQSVKQGLDRQIASYSNGSPTDQRLADRLSDVRDSVLNLAARADPDNASGFQSANQAYSLLSRVNDAAAKGKDGVFTPQMFRTAVTRRGYGTTTANVATGSAPMQQLSTDASMILPSSVPDSGTGSRMAAMATMGLGASALTGTGAGAGYLLGGDSGALTGAALFGAPYLPGARKVVQAVLSRSRGKALNTLGDFIRDGLPVAPINVIPQQAALGDISALWAPQPALAPAPQQ